MSIWGTKKKAFLWEDQEEGFYFEEISKLEQRWRKYIEAKRDYIKK